ncbi:TPA: hypothetical protein I6Z08_000551 [Vibrio cholerae]|nr:hypothetical protein [Vibrio cholerae]HAS3159410.1 hypothetical protein [Vibrio cholerae]
MKKDKRVTLSIGNLTTCFLMIWSGTVYSLPSYEGHMENGYLVIDSVSIEYDDIVSSTYYDRLVGEHGVTLLFHPEDPKKGTSQYYCPLEGQNIMRGDQLQWASPEEKRQYYLTAMNWVNTCKSFVMQVAPDNWDTAAYWDISVSDGYIGLAGIYTGISVENLPDNPSKPTSCQADISKNIAFGDVRPGGTSIASGVLSVTCDKKAKVTVVVNSGSDYNPPEGGLITFDIDSPQIQDGGVLNDIQIQARLTDGPKQPGSYAWATSVEISFE